MIALPLKIQGHYFEFLVLVVDILDEYDFIIGLEAATPVRSSISYDITHCQYSIQVSTLIFKQRYQNFTKNLHINSVKWRSSLYFYIWYSNYQSTAGRKWIFIQYNRSRIFRSVYLHLCFKQIK